MSLSLMIAAAALQPYEAEITRDRLGIAHVVGETDADAVFGMIYAQAEDDFPRIERNYLENMGRLAEAEGEAALWSDLRQRLWIDEADLRARYEGSPDWLKALCEAWAAGLNQYLADHPEVTPKVLTRFEPWMPLAFSEGSIGADYTQVPLGPLKALYGDGREGDKVAALAKPREHQGSNGIAIAPKLTEDGRALLLINPHTTLFFRDVVHMQSGEGLDAYGAVTWGQFFIYQGFNPRLGWMHTTSGLDNVDFFAEHFVSDEEGGLAYRYGDEVRPITVRPVDIKVKTDAGMELRRFATLATHHGPVTRFEDGKFVATSLMLRPVKALEQSFLRTKARNLDEYIAVSERRANSSNNTILATADGQIAMLLPQYLPMKDGGYDHHEVVDGSDPDTDLGPDRPFDELPNVIDPASGYVFNVNDEPWAAAGPGTLDPAEWPDDVDRFGWNPRTSHALQLLEGSSGWSMQALRDAAYSPMQPAFDKLIMPLVEAWERLEDGETKQALEAPVVALEAWDHRWDADNDVQLLALTYLNEMTDRSRREAPGRYGYEASHAWFDEADDETRLEELRSAIARVTRDWGDWGVRWGDVNVYQRIDGAIEQDFDDDKPAIAVPFTPGSTGSLASANTTTPAGEKRRYNRHGNSFVAVVAFGDEGPEAWMVTAGGISNDPASPHFDDQADNHVEGNLQKVPLTGEQIAAEATASYRVSSD
ncbi:penicillin acylase family protein [Sphingomicrobium clamense]|uniref:Penicillin acylase family protein n=1 Tax=Sphingomicrobium clamense TaxID=2851013 RepID=A0ABS6V477_9SPHN|nr:penicillin acylase family protein [Sphingomicrobium sp. B8]MBW0144358.1 penicillin acylase family protein [Sphingomicrobium sp. B8]